jgi:hypothetical protein
MSRFHVANRLGMTAVLVALCWMVARCSGGKISKANADKITVGMSEQDVTGILGAPSKNAEVAMPNIGGLVPGGIPGMPELPKKAKSSTWEDGTKVITVVFVDGKVSTKTAVGF